MHTIIVECGCFNDHLGDNISQYTHHKTHKQKWQISNRSLNMNDIINRKE